MKKTVIWNLKEIVNSIKYHHEEVQKIYLFGSRAYNTGSLRSDIDLLVITSKQISFASINEWLHDEYPPVDLFLTCDGQNYAISVVNGSCLRQRTDVSLVEQLDAIELWSLDNDFSVQFKDWEQYTLVDINFQMSIIPGVQIENLESRINKDIREIRKRGIETYFAGCSLSEISKSIIKIVENGMTKPDKYSKKANSFNFGTIKLKSEYDFQNFIHFLIRPLFSTIEPENVTITIDGNDKVADFGIQNNKIIIEAKHIKDTSSKATVIKTIESLSSFYACNPNVGSLIFLVLYEPNVDLDELRLNAHFNKEYLDIPVFVRFIKNCF